MPRIGHATTQVRAHMIPKLEFNSVMFLAGPADHSALCRHLRYFHLQVSVF